MASLLSHAKDLRQRLAPVRQTSAFVEKGVLTPQEFVASGDQLVFKCPTWSWAAGTPSMAKPYLPPDKQYLVTRGVPCQRRVSSLEDEYVKETEIEVGTEEESSGGGWLEPCVTGGGGDAVEMEGELGANSGLADSGGQWKTGGPVVDLTSLIVSDDNHFSALSPTRDSKQDLGGAMSGLALNELDTFVEPASSNMPVAADDATLPASAYMVTTEEPKDDGGRLRRYDLSITYDKYYQTPRMFLEGFEEGGEAGAIALPADSVFEDIMADYAHQTVTFEPHPHLQGVHQASIHPCRHASVMQRIVSGLTEDGGEARVDQYLFLFLKFIQSVCPTIDYDFTMDVEA